MKHREVATSYGWRPAAAGVGVPYGWAAPLGCFTVRIHVEHRAFQPPGQGKRALETTSMVFRGDPATRYRGRLAAIPARRGKRSGHAHHLPEDLVAEPRAQGGDGLQSQRGQAFPGPPHHGGIDVAGSSGLVGRRLGHHQQPSYPEKWCRALGGDRWAAERPGPDRLESTPELRVPARSLGPGPDHVHPSFPAQPLHRSGQEQRPALGRIRSTAVDPGQYWASTRPGRPPPDPGPSSDADPPRAGGQPRLPHRVDRGPRPRRHGRIPGRGRSGPRAPSTPGGPGTWPPRGPPSTPEGPPQRSHQGPWEGLAAGRDLAGSPGAGGLRRPRPRPGSGARSTM